MLEAPAVPGTRWESSQLVGQNQSSGFKNPHGDVNREGHKQGVKPCPGITDTTLTCIAGSTAGSDDFWVVLWTCGLLSELPTCHGYYMLSLSGYSESKATSTATTHTSGLDFK